MTLAPFISHTSDYGPPILVNSKEQLLLLAKDYDAQVPNRRSSADLIECLDTFPIIVTFFTYRNEVNYGWTDDINYLGTPTPYHATVYKRTSCTIAS